MCAFCCCNILMHLYLNFLLALNIFSVMTFRLAPRLAYCSAGCSRSNHALSTAPTAKNSTNDGAFVAYASSNFVSVISQSAEHASKNVDAFEIVETPSMKNAQAEVSSVFWFASNLILFGCSDGSLCLYTRAAKHLVSKKLHAEAITSVHACQFESQNTFLAASCSADGLIRVSVVFVDSDGNASIDETTFQDLKCGGRSLPLEVHLTRLDFCKSYLLCVGCDDGIIKMFASPLETLKFQGIVSLIGHTDWLTSIASYKFSSDVSFLVSGSQDSTVRLWKIYSSSKNKETDVLKPRDDGGASLRTDLQKSAINFECPWAPGVFVYIRLETILKGHTDWVYTVDICLDQQSSLMNILTCSIDRSVIVWQEPANRNSEDIWTEVARFARIGGTGSAAGMSYCGARFAQNGRIVVAHSFTGALHAWRRNETAWSSIPMPSGHLGQAADIAWEPSSGGYLLSVGADQTTRLHAAWHKSTLPPIWYEFGRPQVHGYGFNSVASLSPISFVSAADEKAMRVFSMPRLAKDLLGRLCHFAAQDDKSGDSTNDALGATVPALGLTNRGYGEDEEPGNDENLEEMGDDDGEGGGGGKKKIDFNNSNKDRIVTAVSVVNDEQPPTPEVLIQQTLWPEMRKLYAHGSEVYSVDVSPMNAKFGQLIASACKAASADNAQIILWAPWQPPTQQENKTQNVEKTYDWRPVQHLDGPTLTVTQLQFNNTGEYLIGVSRDRTWHLYRRIEDSKMERVASLEKSTSPHARIIWTVGWSHDDKMFATGSRDQQILVWNLDAVVKTGQSNQPTYMTAISGLKSSVTALTFLPHLRKYVVAAGFENGSIVFYLIENNAAIELSQLSSDLCPSKSITRLRFKPHLVENSPYTLAVSSADWSVRLIEIPSTYFG